MPKTPKKPVRKPVKKPATALPVVAIDQPHVTPLPQNIWS